MAKDKEKLLSTLENRVEEHLRVAIKTFQNLDEATLLKPADNGGWSIAQCLWHLNSYGDYYLPHIKKGLEKDGYSETDKFKGSWIGSYFTKSMEPSTGTMKMKAFKNHTPAPDLDAHAVVAEYIRQQELLLDFLNKAKSKNLDKIRIPISISKFVKLKLGDTFQFLIAHDERHIQQALRNL